MSMIPDSGQEEREDRVELITASGHHIIMDDKEGTMILSTAHGVVIILNDLNQEITVESQGSISLRAETEISLQAMRRISIDCSGEVDVKGSIIELN